MILFDPSFIWYLKNLVPECMTHEQSFCSEILGFLIPYQFFRWELGSCAMDVVRNKSAFICFIHLYLLSLWVVYGYRASINLSWVELSLDHKAICRSHCRVDVTLILPVRLSYQWSTSTCHCSEQTETERERDHEGMGLLNLRVMHEAIQLGP